MYEEIKVNNTLSDYKILQLQKINIAKKLSLTPNETK